MSLKHIGLSLEDIQAYLSDSSSYNASEILSIQITRLKEEIQKQQDLSNELTNALALTQSQQTLSVAELIKAEQKFDLVTKKLRNHMEQGTLSTDKDVQSLANQWKELVGEFMPQNDFDFIKAAEKFHEENPGNKLQHGVDAKVYQYISRSLQSN